MQRTLKPLITTLACSMLISTPALSKSWVDTKTSERSATSVTKDDTLVMRTDTSFAQVRVANAEIADVVVLSDRSFQVLGKAGGKTNVMLYDRNNQLVDIVDVTVGFDVASLKKTLFETFPKEAVEVRPLAGGIYLSGDVSSISVAERAVSIAEAYAPSRVTSGLAVRDSHQVMLEVRFVEASRDSIKQLGINLLSQNGGVLSAAGDLLPLEPGDFAIGGTTGFVNSTASAILGGGIGNASLDIRIDALEEQGIIRTLAEPNLVSMSGETASFLAGGEFPIPVSSGLGEVTIEYRKFGVGLAFTPTVLDNGVINLKVAPEVSQLDVQNTVEIAGVRVPGLRVRRANTTVELRNAQSFAIAGLLQNETSNTRENVPWLGKLPIIGSLFSSTRYQSAETELVIIVTPHLARPVSDRSQLSTPLDNVLLPSDAGAFLSGKIEGGFGHAME
ncbi:MAG: type II and III secretion system protein family protein [Litorimonas sp.]